MNNININYDYIEVIERNILPCLPLEGFFDLTYRCNNNCRHCWLRIPADAKEKEQELRFEEIRHIAEEARKLGCRKWHISGGEPMLREDFLEIFDYLTSNFSSYSINTNGTLITPKIAKLMKRKGTKMIALYGATKEVHEHITRTPGSFEATMRGIRYLREAGAGFIIQIVPMKDNFHQLRDMFRLAESLSKYYRIGAAWLYLSASGDPLKNSEIISQRLSPKDVVELDKPDLVYEERRFKESDLSCNFNNDNEYLFGGCILNRRNFHIDPYGKMSFCCFIKDPSLRYDLRKGSFKDCWNNFIPSLAKKIKATQEYIKTCGSCSLRNDCRFCPVYGYLEHRDFNKKVDYLCAVAKENRRFKENWKKNHRRYFKIADITIQLDSDLPITESTFNSKIKLFEVDAPGEDNIYIRHRFFLPDIEEKKLGREIYRKPPWAIYRKNNSLIYLGISTQKGKTRYWKVMTSNFEHTNIVIYNEKEEEFLKGNLGSLSLLPTDQIILARLLADRQGCILHSCGVNLEGKGLLFVGNSGAGKSTMAGLLKDKAEILCDDRMIIRNTSGGFKIYGNWSHGDVAEVSSGSAPLKAIMFLKKAKNNRLIHMENKKEIIRRIFSCIIKPFITFDWWEKTLLLIDKAIDMVPCYILEFNKDEEVISILKEK